MTAPDDRIPSLFDEYCAKGLAKMNVGWKEYREHRLAGTWNEEVRRRFSYKPERFMVKEDG